MEVERINPWMQVGVLCESNTVHETRLYSGLPTTTANQSTIKNNKSFITSPSESSDLEFCVDELKVSVSLPFDPSDESIVSILLSLLQAVRSRSKQVAMYIKNLFIFQIRFIYR